MKHFYKGLIVLLLLLGTSVISTRSYAALPTLGELSFKYMEGRWIGGSGGGETWYTLPQNTVWDPFKNNNFPFQSQVWLLNTSSVGYGFKLHLTMTVTSPIGIVTSTKVCDTSVITRGGGGLFDPQDILITDGSVNCADTLPLEYRANTAGEVIRINMKAIGPGGGNTCGDTPCWLYGTGTHPFTLDYTLTFTNGVAPTTPVPGTSHLVPCVSYDGGACTETFYLDPKQATVAYRVKVHNGSNQKLTQLSLTAGTSTRDGGGTEVAPARTTVPLSSPLEPNTDRILDFPSFSYNFQTNQNITVNSDITGTYTYENGATGTINGGRLTYYVDIATKTCTNFGKCDIVTCGADQFCEDQGGGLGYCKPDTSGLCTAKHCVEDLKGYVVGPSDSCAKTPVESIEGPCCLASIEPGVTPPQPPIPPAENTYKGPTVTIKELIALIYKIMVPVSVGFGLFFIILAGYTLKTSEGDPIKKKAGMEQLSAAIIGTLFVVLSLTILQIIITSVLGGTP